MSLARSRKATKKIPTIELFYIYNWMGTESPSQRHFFGFSLTLDFSPSKWNSNAKAKYNIK